MEIFRLPTLAGSFYVAPLAGAWIEIGKTGSPRNPSEVALLAGAWIEMLWQEHDSHKVSVAPLAGAWIEMEMRSLE